MRPVITSSDRIDDALLSRCPGLRAVCSASVGYNHIDVEACTRHGVMATNTPGVLTNSVADMAICLTLATLRRLGEGERMVRAGQWEGTHLKQLLGHDLHHARVGIAGFGRIGQAIARRLRGFEAKVMYHSRNPRRIPDRARAGRNSRKQGRAAAAVGRPDSDPALHAGDTPLHRPGRAGEDEAFRRPDQYGARGHRGRHRARPGAEGSPHLGGGIGCLRRRNRR